MSKDILSALEEQFNQECLAINVKEEYPDYLGTEQWIIITDLSNEELTARYEDLINRYYPYIKLSVEQGNRNTHNSLMLAHFRCLQTTTLPAENRIRKGKFDIR